MPIETQMRQEIQDWRTMLLHCYYHYCWWCCFWCNDSGTRALRIGIEANAELLERSHALEKIPHAP